FSSRRRHTRFSRDWSSDVCSSDLINRNGRNGLFQVPESSAHRNPLPAYQRNLNHQCGDIITFKHSIKKRTLLDATDAKNIESSRSEERRVGKEWKSREWE